MASLESRPQALALAHRIECEDGEASHLEEADTKQQITTSDGISESAQLQSLFDTKDENSGVFNPAEVARKGLEECCLRLSKEIDSVKDSKFSISRKSAKMKANAEIIALTGSDFSGVTALVNGLEVGWKQKHQKVYHRFVGICESLNSHKEIFAIFPSQSMYTSIFCGALSMLVKAAVNHDTIAETLSRTLEQISTKAARCANLLHIIRTDSLKCKLAEVYANVFYFFRDIVEWYLKSRTSRFFGSFNDKVNEKFEETAKAISERIEEIEKEAAVGGLAMQRVTLQGVKLLHESVDQKMAVLEEGIGDIQAELLRQRQQSWRNHEPNFDIRSQMVYGLLESFDEVSLKSQDIEYKITKSKRDKYEVSNGNKDVKPRPGISESEKPRDLALRNATHMQKYVIGHSGLDLLDHRKNRLLDTMTITRLRKWLSTTRTSETLWICGPSDSKNESSATGSGLLPRLSERERGQKVQLVGLTSLIYNLIYQLLQFNVEDDRWEPNHVPLEGLDGSDGSWSKGILLLDELLLYTPQLSYCIIHGINKLEVAGGSERCNQLVDVLLKHQKRAEQPFSILFTTSGQSRLLVARTQSRDRHIIAQRMTDVRNIGKLLDFSPIMLSKNEGS
ncbi:hypothetical protein BGZ60DRAFT_255871 [Tricladium varicosporioides]|nr:hypothetical protein BGZ60DRAFT_255871 [Hymenoscyphus varicosporioides]